MDQPFEIVFFSGTGGTRLAAELLGEDLENRGQRVSLHPLDLSRDKAYTTHNVHEGLPHKIILLFPVYALDAPKPVYRWIRSLPVRKGGDAAVISVSGGGEIWPNRSCRRGCINLLRRKGIQVFYENMLVMPSNILISTPATAKEHLIRILPQRISLMAEEILQDKQRRDRFRLSSWAFSWVSLLFHRKGDRNFSKALTVGKECAGCGSCATQCPQANISMKKGRPYFHHTCVMCMRCIYGCPRHVIYPEGMDFLLLKEGYDLPDIIRKVQEELPPPQDAPPSPCPGLLWTGVRRYIKQSAHESV